MIKCNICYMWHPNQWNGWKWVDEFAYCNYHDKDTMYCSTCEHGAMTPPPSVEKMHKVKLTPRVPTVTATNVQSTPVPKMYEIGASVPVEIQAPEEHKSPLRHDPLFKHQREAIERFKDEAVIGLLFDPGCAKTRTALEIAKYKYQQMQINALLIIAPNRVHLQWMNQEIPAWFGDGSGEDGGIKYDAQVLGGASKRKSHPFRDDCLQILCINIDTFSTPTKWREVVEWALYNQTMIVVDESTTIKSPKAKRTERLIYEFNETKWKGRRLVSSVPKTVARAILTGTPLTNSPCDVWSMYEFLKPSYFGLNYYAFQAHYTMQRLLPVKAGGQERLVSIAIGPDEWWQIKHASCYREAEAIFGINEDTYNTILGQETYSGPYKRIEELKKRMLEHSMFARAEECLDMPERNYITRTVEMDSEQAAAYEQMESELMTTYNDIFTDAKSKVVALIRLQQITSGFVKGIALEDDLESEDEADVMPSPQIRWFEHNPRMEALFADLEGISDPAIVMTKFTCEADYIYNRLINQGRKVMMVTGWKRVGTIDEFQAGQYEIMVANINAIAMGFNLQNAHRIYFYSNTFSLEKRTQAEARIYRSGQKNTCLYFDYEMRGTIDRKIVKALQEKRQLAEYIRSNDLKTFVSKWDGMCE